MSNTERQHDRLLKEHGFELIRTTKHRVYRNPEGRVYVTSSTPSDWRVANNRLTALKRCLASPIKPMSLATSDFERQEAATLIEGRRKAITGMGGASKSRGTGFFYDDRKILTVGQLQQIQAMREQALANRLRRQEKQKKTLAERRARKLIRLQAEAQAEEEFRRDYQFWLDCIENTLDTLDRNYENMCEKFIENRAWKEPFFYEFIVPDPEETGITEEEFAETWAHQFFRDEIRFTAETIERGEFEGCGCDECLRQTELNVVFLTDHLMPQVADSFTRILEQSHDSDLMVQAVMHAAERQLRRSNSWFGLALAIISVRPRNARWAHVVRMLVVMMGRWDYDEKLFVYKVRGDPGWGEVNDYSWSAKG